jgi:hypothetical protein
MVPPPTSVRGPSPRGTTGWPGPVGADRRPGAVGPAGRRTRDMHDPSTAAPPDLRPVPGRGRCLAGRARRGTVGVGRRRPIGRGAAAPARRSDTGTDHVDQGDSGRSLGTGQERRREIPERRHRGQHAHSAQRDRSHREERAVHVRRQGDGDSADETGHCHVPDALVGAVGVTAQTSITTAAPANGGLAEEISKLAALRDQGVLTNEESRPQSR